MPDNTIGNTVKKRETASGQAVIADVAFCYLAIPRKVPEKY